MEQKGYITAHEGIDITKFIMSFAVIAIHAPEYLWPNDRSYPWIIDWFIRLAVPFFFITSGFLTQERMDNMSDQDSCRVYLQGRAYKLIRIWGMWLFIYMPLALWNMSSMTNPIGQRLLDYVKDILLTGRSAYAQPLWFIYSMAIITWLWSLFERKRTHLWLLFIFFFVLSFLGVFNCKYIGNEYVNDVIVWGFGGGMPIMGGALLYSYRNNIQLIFNYTPITICCISLSLVLYISKLPFYPMVGGLAVFILSYYAKSIWKLDYWVLRKESMWIYYIHMYVIIASMVIFRYFAFSFNKWLVFIVISGITYGISIGITHLCMRSKFKLLEILIR